MTQNSSSGLSSAGHEKLAMPPFNLIPFSKKERKTYMIDLRQELAVVAPIAGSTGVLVRLLIAGLAAIEEKLKVPLRAGP